MVHGVGTTVAGFDILASILVMDAELLEAAAVAAEPKLERTAVWVSGTQLVAGQLHSMVNFQKHLE